MNLRTLDIAALAALEHAIGAALAMDPHARHALAPLAGKVLRVASRVPQADVFVLPQVDGLRLSARFEGRVDCTVDGAASDFVALALAADKPSALVNGNLRVTGDSALLLDLEKALTALDVDWEQRLSLLIGDAAAHHLGRTLRGSARLGQRARTRFEQHLEEFIHEEARLAPPRAEVEDFLADLRAFAARADRLEAGVQRLARRLRSAAIR